MSTCMWVSIQNDSQSLRVNVVYYVIWVDLENEKGRGGGVLYGTKGLYTEEKGMRLVKSELLLKMATNLWPFCVQL